jgi:hypothetical protein
MALLSTVLNRIPLAYPVGSEVIGDIEDLHVSKPKVMQLPERRSNVGTAIPRTATAVQHDKGLPGERGHPLLQLFETRRLRTSSGVLCPLDVSLGKKDMRANLQDQGLGCVLGLKQTVQFVWLKQLRLGD